MIFCLVLRQQEGSKVLSFISIDRAKTDSNIHTEMKFAKAKLYLEGIDGERVKVGDCVRCLGVLYIKIQNIFSLANNCKQLKLFLLVTVKKKSCASAT